MLLVGSPVPVRIAGAPSSIPARHTVQVYDPAVVRERYTTHGDEVNVVKSKHDPGAATLKGFAPTH